MQRNSEEAIDLVLEKACPLGEKMWDEYEQTKYVPFNPTDKFTTAQIRQKSNGESFRLMKGAPQVSSLLWANRECVLALIG